MLPCFRIQEMQKVIYYVWITLPSLPISNLDACFAGGGAVNLYKIMYLNVYSQPTFPAYFCLRLRCYNKRPFLLSLPQIQDLTECFGQIPGRRSGPADSMPVMLEYLMSQGLGHLYLIVN